MDENGKRDSTRYYFCKKNLPFIKARSRLRGGKFQLHPLLSISRRIRQLLRKITGTSGASLTPLQLKSFIMETECRRSPLIADIHYVMRAGNTSSIGGQESLPICLAEGPTPLLGTIDLQNIARHSVDSENNERQLTSLT